MAGRYRVDVQSGRPPLVPRHGCAALFWQPEAVPSWLPHPAYGCRGPLRRLRGAQAPYGPAQCVLAAAAHAAVPPPPRAASICWGGEGERERLEDNSWRESWLGRFISIIGVPAPTSNMAMCDNCRIKTIQPPYIECH